MRIAWEFREAQHLGDTVTLVEGGPVQPMPSIGDVVVGPDDMGEHVVSEIVWNYTGGFYPAPRGVTVICTPKGPRNGHSKTNREAIA